MKKETYWVALLNVAAVFTLLNTLAIANADTYKLGAKQAEQHGCASARSAKSMTEFLGLKVEIEYPDGGVPVMRYDWPDEDGKPTREAHRADLYKGGEWSWEMPTEPDATHIVVHATLFTTYVDQEWQPSIYMRVEQIYRGGSCSERVTSKAVR